MDFGLLFPLLHQSGCDSLVLAANLRSQVPYVGKLPCRLQTHNLEGSRSHHLLFLVIEQWDPIKHLVQSKMVCLAWSCGTACLTWSVKRCSRGLKSSKGQRMGWCSFTCGERPGTSTSFCRNCQECWCTHRAQSAPSNPAVPAWPWWPLGGPGPGHDLGHEHQDLPLCHVQQLPGKGVFFRPSLYRAKKLIKQISLNLLHLWLRNFQFYPFYVFSSLFTMFPGQTFMYFPLLKGV